MKIAVIPARGGSKRIPRKNIRDFCGKPMIAWSIGAALDSGCFDRVIVSTDDEEIAETARQYGAEVPFLRPKKLSDDFTGTIPVVKHATQWCLDNWGEVGYVCCLYATAPFVSPEAINSGISLLIDSKADYAFSVTSYPFPIQRAIRVKNEKIEMFWPDNFAKRSQDLEEAWHDAGQFYWGTAEAWCNEKVIFSSGSVAVKLPRYRVQDIDTEEDWRRAELMFRALLDETGNPE